MQLLLGIEGVYLPTFLPDGGKNHTGMKLEL